MKVAMTSSSAGVKSAGSAGGVTLAFSSACFSIFDQHFDRAQIGGGRFVDQLCDDRLALGDLAALAVDCGRHRRVQHLDQQRRQVFQARFARIAGLAFLETGVHRGPSRVSKRFFHIFPVRQGIGPSEVRRARD